MLEHVLRGSTFRLAGGDMPLSSLSADRKRRMAALPARREAAVELARAAGPGGILANVAMDLALDSRARGKEAKERRLLASEVRRLGFKGNPEVYETDDLKALAQGLAMKAHERSAAAGATSAKEAKRVAKLDAFYKELDTLDPASPTYARDVHRLEQKHGFEAHKRDASNDTTSMKEYLYAVSQGYEGDFAKWKADNRSKGTTVNVGGKGDENFFEVEPGLYGMKGPDGQPLLDDNGEIRPVRAANSKLAMAAAEAEREAAELEDKEAKAATVAERAADVVIEDIGRVRDAVMKQSVLGPVTGLMGSAAGLVPGSDAFDARKLTETIRANIGFDRLQQMREASPTGGALGAVSQRELSDLQAVLGNLELSQSKEQILRNLDRLEAKYQEIVHGPGGGAAPQGDDNWTDAGAGVRIRVKE